MPHITPTTRIPIYDDAFDNDAELLTFRRRCRQDNPIGVSSVLFGVSVHSGCSQSRTDFR